MFLQLAFNTAKQAANCATPFEVAFPFQARPSPSASIWDQWTAPRQLYETPPGYGTNVQNMGESLTLLM